MTASHWNQTKRMIGSSLSSPLACHVPKYYHRTLQSRFNLPPLTSSPCPQHHISDTSIVLQIMWREILPTCHGVYKTIPLETISKLMWHTISEQEEVGCTEIISCIVHMEIRILLSTPLLCAFMDRLEREDGLCLVGPIMAGNTEKISS